VMTEIFINADRNPNAKNKKPGIGPVL
jgi:hypothetical protein